MFSSFIPFMKINQAEILAIHRAIAISSGCDHIKHSKIIVEFDSTNTIQLCNAQSEGSWNLNFILNFIRNASTADCELKIVYKRRGSNVVADTLAKQGMSRSIGTTVASNQNEDIAAPIIDFYYTPVVS